MQSISLPENFSLLIGRNLRPFPENTALYWGWQKQEVLILKDTILNIFDRDAVKLECKCKNLLHTIHDIERKIDMYMNCGLYVFDSLQHSKEQKVQLGFDG